MSQPYRFGYCIAAILLYALFGLPTPNHPGAIEIIIGVLLIMSMGLNGGINAFTFSRESSAFKISAQILLLYGLSVPVVTGLLTHGAAMPIARDLFPFLFLLLPLLLDGVIKTKEQRIIYLLSILALGLVFSLRASLEFAGAFLGALQNIFQSGELTYFANAPTLLFAAVYLTGLAIQKWTRGISVKTVLHVTLLFLLVAIIALPLSLTMQRASLGYLLLSTIAFLCFGLWRAPYPTLILCALIALIFAPLYPYIADILDALLQKTSMHGFNMRFEEAAAVWTEISDNPFHTFFGLGWGASFESPAVAGIRVNYTHSLLTSLLLKTGLTGLFLGLAYIGLILRGLIGFLRGHMILALALIGPILIDTVLYASFKSLDFGLVLLMVSMAVKVAKPHNIL